MVKFLDGDASNSSGCVSVDDGKIARLKSYDYHVLLQRVLPISLRGVVNKDVTLAVIELCYFFQRLCCKTLRRDYLEKHEKDIISILCKLEMIFPPAFFLCYGTVDCAFTSRGYVWETSTISLDVQNLEVFVQS